MPVSVSTAMSPRWAGRHVQLKALAQYDTCRDPIWRSRPSALTPRSTGWSATWRSLSHVPNDGPHVAAIGSAYRDGQRCLSRPVPHSGSCDVEPLAGCHRVTVTNRTRPRLGPRPSKPTSPPLASRVRGRRSRSDIRTGRSSARTRSTLSSACRSRRASGAVYRVRT